MYLKIKIRYKDYKFKLKFSKKKFFKSILSMSSIIKNFIK